MESNLQNETPTTTTTTTTITVTGIEPGPGVSHVCSECSDCALAPIALSLRHDCAARMSGGHLDRGESSYECRGAFSAAYLQRRDITFKPRAIHDRRPPPATGNDMQKNAVVCAILRRRQMHFHPIIPNARFIFAQKCVFNSRMELVLTFSLKYLLPIITNQLRWAMGWMSSEYKRHTRLKLVVLHFYFSFRRSTFTRICVFFFFICCSCVMFVFVCSVQVAMAICLSVLLFVFVVFFAANWHCNMERN